MKQIKTSESNFCLWKAAAQAAHAGESNYETNVEAESSACLNSAMAIGVFAQCRPTS